MERKIYFLTKICFFIVVIFVSIFLKANQFLGYIAPIGAFDQTDTIIQFNEFSNVLTLVVLKVISSIVPS